MGKIATQTFQLIKHPYGDNALSLSLSHTWVCELYARFWDGHENLNDEFSGPPTTIQTADMIKTDRELI
jgi:hypothetical protein